MQQRHSLETNVLAVLAGLVAMFFLCSIAFAQDVPGLVVPDLQISRADRLNVFNKAWETVNKH